MGIIQSLTGCGLWSTPLKKSQLGNFILFSISIGLMVENKSINKRLQEKDKKLNKLMRQTPNTSQEFLRLDKA